MAQCHMIIGTLIPHRCPYKARAVCVQCQRPFCDEHISLVDAGVMCLACQQGFQQPVGSKETYDATSDFDVSDFEVFYQDDDPFVDLS